MSNSPKKISYIFFYLNRKQCDREFRFFVTLIVMRYFGNRLLSRSLNIFLIIVRYLSAKICNCSHSDSMYPSALVMDLKLFRKCRSSILFCWQKDHRVADGGFPE